MKKIFKITAIVIGSLVGLLLLAAVLVPVLFKDKLVQKAKVMVNESVNAKVDFKDVSISIFKNFPDITLSLNDITVVGIGEFQKDTLAAISSFSTSINIMSYIKKGIVDVKTVTIKQPRIYALVLEDGKANWDIMKVDTALVDSKVAAADTTQSDFVMSLAKVEIVEGAVLYHDMSTNMLATLDDVNIKVKGDMYGDKTTLDVNAVANKINAYYEGRQILTDASMTMDTKVDADLKNMIFTLRDNETLLAKIPFEVNGAIKMIDNEQEDIEFDLTYAAKIASLDDLMKAISVNVKDADLKGVQTRGTMSLKGWIKGVYNDVSMPQFWAELSVADGYIKYAELSESISNLGVDMKILFDYNNDENTVITVNRFHFEVAGNPFDINANVRTPMTDADIKLGAKGKINFKSLASALPLSDIKMTGILTADVNFAGRMSAIEKEQYDKLNIAGQINLQNLTVKSKDVPMEIEIMNTDLAFTPRYVELKSFSSKIGKTDLQMQGRLDNFINYIVKDEMLKGSLKVTSHNIDFNELMAASDSGTSKKDTTATQSNLSVIVLPGDIDFTMDVKADKITYNKLSLTNATGNVTLRGGELTINNLNMGFAGGTMALSGKYKATDPSKAITGLNMNIKNVEIGSVLSSFDMFGKMLPALGALGGRISLGFNFATDLDNQMSPILTSLAGIGSVEGDSIKIVKSDNFNQITSLVGLKNMSDASAKVLKSVKASFAVKDGKVQVTPFPVKIAGVNMMVGGQQGLDQIADFQIDMAVPAAQLTGKANDLMKQIGLPGTNANTVNVGVAIGGSVTSPTFKLVAPKYMDNKGIGQQAADQAKNMVQEKTNEILNSVISGGKTTSTDSTAKSTEQKKVDNAVNQIKDLFKKKQ